MTRTAKRNLTYMIRRFTGSISLVFVILSASTVHIMADEDSWRFSVGVTAFAHISVTDRFYLYATDGASRNSGDYGQGQLLGGRISIAKGGETLGLGVFSGDGDFDVEGWSKTGSRRRAQGEKERRELDLYWNHRLGAGDNYSVAMVLGVKHLKKDQVGILEEWQGSRYDAVRYKGTVEWLLGAIGLSGAWRPSLTIPLYISGSGNLLGGQVNGLGLADNDTVFNGSVEVDIDTDAEAAIFGLNASVGLQYMILERVIIGFGGRGQYLMGGGGDIKFDEEQISLYGNLDILF